MLHTAARTIRRLIALALLCATAVPAWTVSHSGVPGRTVRIDADTNLDGRADRQDLYAGGALVQRSIDRNLDGRVDLVESFDPRTRELTRSVVDVDFDGTGDLLVLFQDGSAVVSSWRETGAAPADEVTRHDGGMVDPFRTRTALDAGFGGPSDSRTVALVSAIGLLVNPVGGAATQVRALVVLPSVRLTISDPPSLSPTRGPPSHLLA